MLPSRTDAPVRAAPGGHLERHPTFADAVATFLEEKAVLTHGITDSTPRNYRNVLVDLRDDVRPVSCFDVAFCRQLFAVRVRRGLKASSLNTHWAVLSAFGAWLVAEGFLRENPMRAVRKPPPILQHHRYLADVELRRLWSIAGEPDRLVMLLLIEGLRASELCLLRWRDVRSDRIAFAGKGGKLRTIPLRAGTRRRLDALAPATPGDRIFDFDYYALYRRLQALGRKAGIHGLRPHLFRHSFASLSLAMGLDQGALAQLGGWQQGSRAMEGYLRSVREDVALEQARRIDLPGHVFSDD
jgi:integrase